MIAAQLQVYQHLSATILLHHDYPEWASVRIELTAVGFEPAPFRNGALSHRLRPLGQTVLVEWFKQVGHTRSHVLVVQGG